MCSESQYNTSVVYSQYDIWADPPTVRGTWPAPTHRWARLHDLTAYAAPQQIETPLSRVHWAETTTTYMIPSPTPPLPLPLKQIGVPDWIVGGLNNVLKPLSTRATHSTPPPPVSYFSHGTWW